MTASVFPVNLTSRAASSSENRSRLRISSSSASSAVAYRSRAGGNPIPTSAISSPSSCRIPSSSRAPHLTLRKVAPMVKNRTKAVVIATILTALADALAGSAQAGRADYRGDPRKCATGKPAVCARDSAKTVLRIYLGKRAGTVSLYQGPTDCRQASATSLLKWRCTFGVASAGTAGTASVVFYGTPSGWKHRTTVLSG